MVLDPDSVWVPEWGTLIAPPIDSALLKTSADELIDVGCAAPHRGIVLAAHVDLGEDVLVEALLRKDRRRASRPFDLEEGDHLPPRPPAPPACASRPAARRRSRLPADPIVLEVVPAALQHVSRAPD